MSKQDLEDQLDELLADLNKRAQTCFDLARDCSTVSDANFLKKERLLTKANTYKHAAELLGDSPLAQSLRQ